MSSHFPQKSLVITEECCANVSNKIYAGLPRIKALSYEILKIGTRIRKGKDLSINHVLSLKRMQQVKYQEGSEARGKQPSCFIWRFIYIPKLLETEVPHRL